MSQYNELKKALTVYASDHEAYWSQIYHALSVLNSKYSAYLGLNNEFVTDKDGERIPAFITGTYDKNEGRVIPHAPAAFEHDEDKLCFAIQLNLRTIESPEAIGILLAEAKVSKNNEYFVFEVDSLEKEILCKEIKSEIDFEPFFDSLQNLFLEKLKFYKKN